MDKFKLAALLPLFALSSYTVTAQNNIKTSGNTRAQVNNLDTLLVLGIYDINKGDRFLRCVDKKGKESILQFRQHDCLENNAGFVERGDKIVIKDGYIFYKNLTVEKLKKQFIKSK